MKLNELLTETFTPQLIDFLTGEPHYPQSAWFKTHGLNVYLRRTTRAVQGKLVPTVDVANVKANTPGNKSFTSFLNDLEQLVDRIYVENIFNERLISFLERRGYKIVDKLEYLGDIPSMYWEKHSNTPLKEAKFSDLELTRVDQTIQPRLVDDWLIYGQTPDHDWWFTSTEIWPEWVGKIPEEMDKNRFAANALYSYAQRRLSAGMERTEWTNIEEWTKQMEVDHAKHHNIEMNQQWWNEVNHQFEKEIQDLIKSTSNPEMQQLVQRYFNNVVSKK